MALIIAVFLSASIGLKNFKLDASSDALVIEGDEAFKIYRETGEIFGNSDFLIHIECGVWGIIVSFYYFFCLLVSPIAYFISCN